MKKVLFLIVSIVILGLVFAGCGGITNITAPSTSQEGITYVTKHTEEEPFDSILYAGQTIPVGNVYVWNDDVELHVTYNTTGGWVLTETHLAVATALEDIPQKNGNPIPGKFPYQCCYNEDEVKWIFQIKNGGAPGATCDADGNTNATLTEVEYIIPLSEIGDGVDCEELLYIAAHASLLNLDNVVGFVPDTGDPIYQEETGWGDNGLGFPGKNWATYFEYSVQCPCIVEYPADGNVYIGYEDWPNGDFDYNDFGMYFSAVETYTGGCDADAQLTSVLMTFTAQVYDSGMTHHIHIERPIVGGSQVTVTRPDRAAAGDETAAGTFAVSGDVVDVVLFDTANYTWPSKLIGETVTVEIAVDDPSQNPKGTPAAPRWDLVSFMANYDPWEIGSLYGSLYHIEDEQLVTAVTSGAHSELLDGRLVTLTLPYILVVPSSDWTPPFEDTCISGPGNSMPYPPGGPYGYFYDYYNTTGGSHLDWYMDITDSTVGLGGLSW